MRILSYYMFVATAIAIGAASNVAFATDVVGNVKTLEGEATLVSGGKAIPVALGAEIHINDILQTSLNGAVGVTFRDNSRISIGPDTDFYVEDYLFDPHNNKLSFVSNIQKGTLEYVSGTIAKLAPDSVSMKTPSGAIGVRGTRFVLKVSD
ncbi:exported hypothetical protein [Azospirillaceae bacterium]